jgi:MFS family permease
VGNWRLAFGIGASCLLLIWPVMRFIPEWIVPLKDTATVKSVSLTHYRTELLSGILIYGSMLIGIWSAFSWLPTWVQSLLGEGNAEGQSQRGLSVALLGAGGMLGGILSGFMANSWGRKPVQAVCFIACFALSYFLFQMNTTYSVNIPVGIALLGIFFGMSQGVLNTYIPELFPAMLRASATGLCFHSGRIFTAMAVWFVGAFVVWFGSYGDAIFAFSFVYLLGLLSLFLLKK